MYTWYMQVVCEQSSTTLPRLHDQTRKLLMKTTATDAKAPVRHLRRSIMQTPSLRIQLGRQLRMFEKRMMFNLITQALLHAIATESRCETCHMRETNTKMSINMHMTKKQAKICCCGPVPKIVVSICCLDIDSPSITGMLDDIRTQGALDPFRQETRQDGLSIECPVQA